MLGRLASKRCAQAALARRARKEILQFLEPPCFDTASVGPGLWRPRRKQTYMSSPGADALRVRLGWWKAGLQRHAGWAVNGNRVQRICKRCPDPTFP